MAITDRDIAGILHLLSQIDQLQGRADRNYPGALGYGPDGSFYGEFGLDKLLEREDDPLVVYSITGAVKKAARIASFGNKPAREIFDSLGYLPAAPQLHMGLAAELLELLPKISAERWPKGERGTPASYLAAIIMDDLSQPAVPLMLQKLAEIGDSAALSVIESDSWRLKGCREDVRCGVLEATTKIMERINQAHQPVDDTNRKIDIVRQNSPGPQQKHQPAPVPQKGTIL